MIAKEVHREDALPACIASMVLKAYPFPSLRQFSSVDPGMELLSGFSLMLAVELARRISRRTCGLMKPLLLPLPLLSPLLLRFAERGA